MKLRALLPLVLISALLVVVVAVLGSHPRPGSIVAAVLEPGARPGSTGLALLVRGARDERANAPTGDPVDSARSELAIGRHWHAARILRPLRADLDHEELLLLARAEAGHLNWRGVRSVLEEADWLGDTDSGEGWRLLARALEEGAEAADAAAAWERYLASPAGREDIERDALRARLALLHAEMDEAASAAVAADSLAGASAALGSWLALELAEEAARTGDVEGVRSLRALMAVPETRRRSWEMPARAHLEAGDTAGAEAAYRAALDSLRDGTDRAAALVALGGFRLRAADTAAARTAYLRALDADPRSRSAVSASARLLELGGLDAGRALQAARALERGSEHRLALEAYGLHATLLGRPLPPATRLDRARLLSLVPARHDDALEEFRALDGTFDEEAAAVRHLSLWMDLRRRQGRSGDVATIRGWILERHPSSAEAVEVVFFRGDGAHDRGALDEALRHYGELQRMNSSLDRSGLARMRMAQIHLGRNDRTAALEVYRGYLEEYPEGRRWDEATYWIGRILLEGGDTAGGEAALRAIGERDPLSYYAVQAAELLGEPYRPSLPGSAAPEPLTPALSEGLRAVDLLDAAGLHDGRDAALRELTESVSQAPEGVALTFAHALLDRGLTLEAVNVAWTLRQRGVPWSRALLEVAYPFPYRDMVTRAARERGVDPITVAALIRQESAFDSDIVSVAGAVGLMQVMPATGRELARQEGPEDFSVASLEAPEVNLHLGTRFFRDMWERYDRSLPFVLSAYNAGPTRATAWRSFPEAADPLRFTERIPFRETRDYVKQVTRNLALYRALYADS